MSLTKKTYKELYYKMFLTREFEEAAAKFFIEGKVHGPAHFCIGQEASVIGVPAALTKEDYILQTHRGHGHAIGKGMDIKKMLAEFLGRETGYGKGRGGSMHIADLSVGSLGANGIVGGGIPLAVGAGLTQQYQERDSITVCFFGDGAANEGAFHESLNLSSVWKLPIIWVCTNNQYGISSFIGDAMNIDDISIRASSYGMKGITLDGNDVLNIYKETQKAKEYVKKNGPMLIVLNTYRWMGHSKVDPQVYRDQKDVEEWKKRCPIKKYRDHLLNGKILTEKDLKELEEQALADLREAVEFAENSPQPRIETIYDDVYAP